MKPLEADLVWERPTIDAYESTFYDDVRLIDYLVDMDAQANVFDPTARWILD